jgi:hypothetical protein
MIFKAHRFSSIRNSSGGIRLRAAIVLITLCIVGGAIYQLLHSFGQKQQVDHRKALAISEYGLQVALQQAPTGSTLPSAIPKSGYDDGWYQVTTQKRVENDTLFCTVTSQGHFGSATERRTCILRLEISGDDSLWVRESMY